MNRTCRMIAKNVVGLALGMACLAGAGCFQIETLVDFHEDGSATITERVNFSRRLLDMAASADDSLRLEPLLRREAVLERMKDMGKGVQLVSHRTREGERGSLECVSVFRTPDLNGFRYVSVWPSYADFPQNNTVEMKVIPMYNSRPYGGHGTGAAGSLIVRLDFPGGRPKGQSGDVPEQTLRPSDAQVLRDLSPMFSDMIEDFMLKLTFRAYAPVYASGNLRETRAHSHSADLISLSSDDMDRHGHPFFENEEIMLRLLQWHLADGELARHLRDYRNNLTLPVLTMAGSRHMWHMGHGTGSAHDIFLPPSRPLFDRYFKGKTLDYTTGHYGPTTRKDVPATWERIGYRPAGKQP